MEVGGRHHDHRPIAEAAAQRAEEGGVEPGEGVVGAGPGAGEGGGRSGGPTEAPEGEGEGVDVGQDITVRREGVERRPPPGHDDGVEDALVLDQLDQRPIAEGVADAGQRVGRPPRAADPSPHRTGQGTRPIGPDTRVGRPAAQPADGGLQLDLAARQRTGVASRAGDGGQLAQGAAQRRQRLPRALVDHRWPAHRPRPPALHRRQHPRRPARFHRQGDAQPRQGVTVPRRLGPQLGGAEQGAVAIEHGEGAGHGAVGARSVTGAAAPQGLAVARPRPEQRRAPQAGGAQHGGVGGGNGRHALDDGHPHDVDAGVDRLRDEAGAVELDGDRHPVVEPGPSS